MNTVVGLAVIVAALDFSTWKSIHGRAYTTVEDEAAARAAFAQNDAIISAQKKKVARSDVGERARPCRTQRLCEFAGCDVAQAASSMVAALLLLLVANVLTDCFMLQICGATLQQSTGTNAACQRHWCLRPS